jgi:hypothetical protein
MQDGNALRLVGNAVVELRCAKDVEVGAVEKRRRAAFGAPHGRSARTPWLGSTSQPTS